MRVRQQTSRQPQWSFTCTFFQICGRPQQQSGGFVSLPYCRLCLFEAIRFNAELVHEQSPLKVLEP